MTSVLPLLIILVEITHDTTRYPALYLSSGRVWTTQAATSWLSKITWVPAFSTFSTMASVLSSAVLGVSPTSPEVERKLKSCSTEWQSRTLLLFSPRDWNSPTDIPARNFPPGWWEESCHVWKYLKWCRWDARVLGSSTSPWCCSGRPWLRSSPWQSTLVASHCQQNQEWKMC